MSESKITLQDYLAPFSNVEQFLKAIIVVSRVYCDTKHNIELVNKYISSIITQITDVQCKSFVQRIINYPANYPIQLLLKFEEFNADIMKYAEETDNQSITLRSPSQRCLFCVESPSEWFDYLMPTFYRDATLYSTHFIGK